MWITITAKTDMAETYDTSTATLDPSTSKTVGVSVGNFEFVDDVVTSYTVPTAQSSENAKYVAAASVAASITSVVASTF